MCPVFCVFNNRFVTLLVRGIRDSLYSAVWKFNFVFTKGGLSSLGLRVGEIVAGEMI